MPAPTYGELEHVTAAAVAIVERYPPDVIARLSDPVAGIAAGSKFFPTLAELTEWCNETADRLAPPRDYAAERAAQLAALPPPVNRSQRPTLAELKAKYGETWGIGAGLADGIPRPRGNPYKPVASYPKDQTAGRVFWANAAAYIARLPAADKKRLPVIRPGQPGWEKWRRYFAHIGYFPRTFIELDRDELQKPRGGFTLPTAFPSDFDLTYTD